ncbi:MAG: M28 family peptidase [Halobacteriales archaeon]
MTLPASVIGSAHTSSYCWELFEELTEIGNRMAGQDGEAAGAEVMAEGFERAGLDDVTVEEFDIPVWYRDHTSLTIEGPWTRTFEAPHDVIGLPGSPADEVAAAIVDAGSGTPEEIADLDLDGKIALVSSQNPHDYGRAINRIEKYVRLADAGAAGFVYYNDVAGAITPTGAIGFNQDGSGPIPGVGVSNEVGRRIHRYLEDGPVEATLSVACSNERSTSQNVSATVGPDTDEEIIVNAHHDAHDIADGARDNGAGSVLVAEVGRLLARTADDLDTRVRLATFGGEETGLYGSYEWARSHDLDAVKCQINLDGIGYSRNLGVTGFDSVTDAFETAADTLNTSVRTGTRMYPFNDQWPFAEHGVASATCRSAPEERGRVVRYGHLEWGHTHADTIDKIDPRDMRDLAIQIAGGVAELAASDYETPNRSPSVIRELVHDDVLEYLELSGRADWPDRS